MADPTIAQQWQQVLQNAQAEQKALATSVAELTDKDTATGELITTLDSEIAAAYLTGDQDLGDALTKQQTALKDMQADTKVQLGSLVSQQAALTEQISYAQLQSDVASSGVPNTQTNVPPASSLPGSPTTVTLSPVPTVNALANTVPTTTNTSTANAIPLITNAKANTVPTTSVATNIASSLAIASLISKPTPTNLLLAALVPSVTNLLSNLFTSNTTPTTNTVPVVTAVPTPAPSNPPDESAAETARLAAKQQAAVTNAALSQTAEQYAAEQEQQYINLAAQSQTAEQYAAQEAAGYAELAKAQASANVAAEEADAAYQLTMNQTAEQYATQEAEAYQQLAIQSQTAEQYAAEQAALYQPTAPNPVLTTDVKADNTVIIPESGPATLNNQNDPANANDVTVLDPQTYAVTGSLTPLTKEQVELLQKSPEELQADQDATAAQLAKTDANIKDITYTALPAFVGSTIESAKGFAEIGQGLSDVVDKAISDPAVWNTFTPQEQQDLLDLKAQGLATKDQLLQQAQKTADDYKELQAQDPNLKDPTILTEEKFKEITSKAADLTGQTVEELEAQVYQEINATTDPQLAKQELADLSNLSPEEYKQRQIELWNQQNPGVPPPTELTDGSELERQYQLWQVANPGVPFPYSAELVAERQGQGLVVDDPLLPATDEERQKLLWEQQNPGVPYPYGDKIENQETVPETPSTGTPYDDNGNLNVGWGLNENGDPVWVGAGYVDATGETLQGVPEDVSGPTGTPYDDNGNLNVGWGLNENGDPVWVGAGYVDATGETLQGAPEDVTGPTGTPYDDNGNLNVGWGLDEQGNPVWVGAGYIDATGETLQGIQPVSGITGTPYDDNGNLNPGWGLDENGNPVWIEAGYIDATGEVIGKQKTVSGPTGTPYDDEGNLNPGWALDEENNPVWVGGDYVEPATQASANASRQAATNAQGLAKTTNAQAQATEQDVNNFYQTGDWRVRLSLAPGANYLYKASDPGILLPLNATNGVLFPYTPAISVVYSAQYDPFDLVHNNYKSYNYKSSSVDQISITCDFTAQDTFEANYLLAVIHFFRSVTKMFYGQDEKPDLGTPPPLCYLSGLGAFQFDKHPLAITSFNYSLPTDVDYIRATHTTTTGGVNKSPSNSGITPTIAQVRGAPTGGNTGSPKWQTNTGGSVTPTYVPTKMQIQLTAVPIVSRNDISRAFSLKKYATGDLLRGSKRPGGGIW